MDRESGGGTAGPKPKRTCSGMSPTEYACAVCPHRGGHRDVREVATPLYGETFGAGVTGPTRRLCRSRAQCTEAHAAVPQPGTAAASRVASSSDALVSRRTRGALSHTCACARLAKPPPSPRHVQVPASVLRAAADAAGLPDLAVDPGTDAILERRATREEATPVLFAGERVMACWQGMDDGSRARSCQCVRMGHRVPSSLTTSATTRTSPVRPCGA